jgi:hypothetical protein
MSLLLIRTNRKNNNVLLYEQGKRRDAVMWGLTYRCRKKEARRKTGDDMPGARETGENMPRTKPTPSAPGNSA